MKKILKIVGILVIIIIFLSFLFRNNESFKNGQKDGQNWIEGGVKNK